MSQITQTFPERLKSLRKARNLTSEQLAHKANVPSTLICALQKGYRSVGENNATKIGVALGLKGTELRDFVYLALNRAVGKLLKESQGYPSELLNLVATQLRAAGITPEQVEGCLVNLGANKIGVAIMLSHGRTAHLETKIAIEP